MWIMLKIICFILLFIQTIGHLGLADEGSKRISACAVNYMTSIKYNERTCDGFEVYVKCILKEAIDDTYTMTSDYIELYKAQMEEAMLRHGLICDFDINEMIEELEDEQDMNLNHNHKPPLSGSTDEDSTGVGACVEIFTTSWMNEELTCEVFKNYVNCMFKDRVLDTLMMTSDDMEKLNAQQEEIMFRHGLSCDLDIKDVIKDLQDKTYMSLNHNSKQSSSGLESEDSNGSHACIHNFKASLMIERTVYNDINVFWNCMDKYHTINGIGRIVLDEIISSYELNKIREELEEEKEKGFFENYNPPLAESGMYTATDECLENLRISLIRKDTACDGMEVYNTCMDKVLSNNSFTVMTSLYTILRVLITYGLRCDFDTNKMMEELKDHKEMNLNQNYKQSLSGLADEDSTGIETCLDNFVASFIYQGPTCDVTEVYLKCMFKELSDDMFMMTSYDMQRHSTYMDGIFYRHGLICDLHFKELMKKLDDTIKMKLVSDAPNGMGACLDNLMTSFLNDEPECDATEVYVTCLLKVFRIVSYTMTQNTMKNLEAGIKTEQSKYKLNCDLDITKIIEKVKNDNEMNFNDNYKRPLTDYRKATSIGECMDIMARRNANVDEGYCHLSAAPFVTCVVRVINSKKIEIDKVNEHYGIIHNITIEHMYAMGSECHFTIPTLFTSADYKENESSLGSIHHYQFVILLVFSVASMLF